MPRCWAQFICIINKSLFFYTHKMTNTLITLRLAGAVTLAENQMQMRPIYRSGYGSPHVILIKTQFVQKQCTPRNIRTVCISAVTLAENQTTGQPLVAESPSAHTPDQTSMAKRKSLVRKTQTESARKCNSKPYCARNTRA
jgi:hypothetical protein